jgi:cytoskeletal protein RodZ
MSLTGIQMNDQTESQNRADFNNKGHDGTQIGILNIHLGRVIILFSAAALVIAVVISLFALGWYTRVFNSADPNLSGLAAGSTRSPSPSKSPSPSPSATTAKAPRSSTRPSSPGSASPSASLNSPAETSPPAQKSLLPKGSTQAQPQESNLPAGHPLPVDTPVSSSGLRTSLDEPVNAELTANTPPWQTTQLKMTMEPTGQLVITGSNGQILWSSPTYQSGSLATIQGDGNFVIYNPDHEPLWATNTNKGPSNSVYLELAATGAIQIIYNGVSIYTFPGT